MKASAIPSVGDFDVFSLSLGGSSVFFSSGFGGGGGGGSGCFAEEVNIEENFEISPTNFKRSSEFFIPDKIGLTALEKSGSLESRYKNARIISSILILYDGWCPKVSFLHRIL